MTAPHRTAKDIVARARSAGRTALTEADGKALLAQFGIDAPRSAVAPDAEAARQAAQGMTAPFVVKVVSPDILHKSDAGGVALHLPDAAAVARAVEEMAAKPAIAGANVEGWLVEEMAPQGQEIVLGGLRDPKFGPMLMVGLGGIFVEVLEDVAFRLCPLTEAEARAALRELRGYPLLAGARGTAPVDEDALVAAMVALGGAGGP